MRFSAWAWVPATTITRRTLCTARLMPAAAPSPALSFVDDCLGLAALNKCLATNPHGEQNDKEAEPPDGAARLGCRPYEK